MKTWFALLRGVNVGGHNKLPMKALAAALAQLGLENVRTYIQSGNVVFAATGGTAAALSTKIAEAIDAEFRFRPKVLVLSLAELTAAARGNPFPGAQRDPKSVHLCFLDGAPSRPDFARIDAAKAKSEDYVLKGRIFYLHTPAGYGVSKLAAVAEKLLGVGATARNWRTVTMLLAMAKGEGRPKQ
ncbi:MAG: DUF1697 domain-containing protein [Parvularculaceae bacterium]